MTATATAGLLRIVDAIEGDTAIERQLAEALIIEAEQHSGESDFNSNRPHYEVVSAQAGVGQIVIGRLPFLIATPTSLNT